MRGMTVTTTPSVVEESQLVEALRAALMDNERLRQEQESAARRDSHRADCDCGDGVSVSGWCGVAWGLWDLVAGWWGCGVGVSGGSGLGCGGVV